MTNQQTKTQTSGAEYEATELLQGDWDTDGTTTVTLPQNLAVAALNRLGWTWGRPAGSKLQGRHWTSPNGREYWDTDEALQVAIATLATVASRPTSIAPPSSQ